MITTDLNQLREYIVTVKKDVDWRTVHNELIVDTSTNDSVDSNIVPDRTCDVAQERANNPRNTHYTLSESEAIKLRQDSRILAVQAVEDIPEPKPRAFQDGEFNRNSSSAGTQDNWGLLRHIKQTNTFNNSTADPGGTYDYVLDGTGVDVVIVDTGIQVGHPEWEANGVSRLKQVNWPTISGEVFTQPANFYTDTNGHGTHCIGTMAGKTFGWCKNSDIYNITLYANSGNNITWSNTVDSLIGWHNKKNDVNDAAYTGNPTVVNMSFGYVWYINTAVIPNTVAFSEGGTEYSITGGRYRGVTHTDTTYAALQNRGLIGEAQGGGVYGYPRKFASQDADVETLVNNGIHVCCAAGNDSMKMDIPGGVDYDNYLSIAVGEASTYYVYYHRGGTPSLIEGGNTLSGPNATEDNPVGDLNEGFMVGALENSDVLDGAVYRDKKTTFSQSGPGVNIYTAGRYIISAQPNNQGSSYFADSSYRQAKYSGTSMASPQMVGMIGCLLQAHPEWTPAQVKKYFESNAITNLNDTGNTDDYTTNTTIHGGPNRVAYFPMHGQKPFNLG